MTHTTPINEKFAQERIAHTISSIDDPRARLGLARLDARLEQERLSPARRLHAIAAVKQLGAISAGSLPDRLARVQRIQSGE